MGPGSRCHSSVCPTPSAALPIEATCAARPVVAVLGAVRGVGRTTVAALLARALVDGSHCPNVLAMDLDASHPSLADALGADARPASANDASQRGSRAAIDVLAPGALGLPLDDAAQAPGLVGLVAHAASRYAAVVLDMPADFGPSTLATLRVASAVVLVATPSHDGIASAVLAARRVARTSPGRIAWIVVNQAAPHVARATFAAIEECCAALNCDAPIELRFLCAVAPDVGLDRAPTLPLFAARPIGPWNLAAARRAVGTLIHEVQS